MFPGRPCFDVTAKDMRLVEALAAHGLTRDEIAEVIGVSRKTLSKHFSGVIADGRKQGKDDEIAWLWARARRGNVDAIIKLLNMGFSDRGSSYSLSDRTETRP